MDLYNSTEEWVVAYLDWIDGQAGERVTGMRSIFMERRRSDRRLAGNGTPRETALLQALRAEADCVNLLRQALEEGQPPELRAH